LSREDIVKYCSYIIYTHHLI